MAMPRIVWIAVFRACSVVVAFDGFSLSGSFCTLPFLHQAFYEVVTAGDAGRFLALDAAPEVFAAAGDAPTAVSCSSFVSVQHPRHACVQPCFPPKTATNATRISYSRRQGRHSLFCVRP